MSTRVGGAHEVTSMGEGHHVGLNNVIPTNIASYNFVRPPDIPITSGIQSIMENTRLEEAECNIEMEERIMVSKQGVNDTLTTEIKDILETPGIKQ